MSSWTIYSKSGVAKWTVKDPEYHDTWMGEEFITASFASAAPLQIEIGDYLVYRGLTYSIYNIPSALKQARVNTYGEGFKYDNVKFSALSTELTEIRFLDYVLFDNELHYTSLPTFSFYCNDVDDLVDRLQANTYRKGGAQWYFITPSYQRTIQRYEEGSAAQTAAISLWESVFGDDTSVEPEYEKTDVNISVDKQSVWDGMSHIKKEFGLNYVIRDRVCIVGGEGIAADHLFKYGKGQGLYQIERSADTEQMVVTKLYAYGSDKNLPVRYYATLNNQCWAAATVVNTSVIITDVAWNERRLFGSESSTGMHNVTISISNTEYNAVVRMGTNSGGEYLTIDRNLSDTLPSLSVGDHIVFTTGIKKDEWPSDHVTYSGDVPNNMAVNVLMLPGFPAYSLSQLCRYTYDSVNDKTVYEIRKTPTSSYSEFMSVDGNHPITFSTNALDPYLLSGNYSDLGVKEGDVHFVEDNDDNGLQEIYPSIEGMTVGDIEGTSSTERLDEILSCDIIDDNGIYKEGETVRSFHLTLKNLGFDLKEAFNNAGGSMTLSMKDGYCGGRDFSVKGVVADTGGTWKLTLERCHDEGLDLWFPYSYNVSIGESAVADEAYQIRTGDHFVLTGIDIGDTSYVWAASMKMLRKSVLWLLNNDYTRFTYLPHVDNIYMARQHDYAVANNLTSLHDTLKAGMLMLFEDTDLDVSGSIFIDSLTIKEHGDKETPTYDVVLREDKQVGTMQRLQNQLNSISSYINSGGGGMSVEAIRSLIRTYGAENFLSKTIADAAQGVISFVKGILFGNGDTGINENGEAKLSSVQTPNYSGTDILSDKGFKVWEDNEGKSHMIVDYFSARVKAIFASLEIRKIEHTAGNRIESPAGNTLALVKKFDENGQEIPDVWYARRYGFGLSWGVKLVYAVGQWFGVWREGSGTVAYYRCYWTAEDKEAKKAVENNWKIGDQAFCQTFNLDSTKTGYASNKRYWRLVVNKGYETINGTDYAYIDLSNLATLYLNASDIDTPIDAQVVDGKIACSGYETGTTDAPEKGDDVACLGNQASWTTRGGAIQYITYGEVDTTTHTGIPCVKMYAGINSFSALDNFCFKKESPQGIFIHSDMFEIVSAAGTGASSPVYCQRGAYSSTATYGKNDIVQYHGASWLYINSTPTSGNAPAEGTYWTAFAQRGIGSPQIVVDSQNAVVSANYEGKISGIGDVTGLPENFEVWVDGNKIPTSAWDLSESYIKYGNITIHFDDSQIAMPPGIALYDISINTDDADLDWRYRTLFDNPVINPFDIIIHVEFEYYNETLVGEASIPMIVQKAAADVLAQYSIDGSTLWHSTFQNGDIYARYSYDGGTTWTSAIRIVGKNIEFDKAIAHFTTYSDLDDYISDDPPLGYYLCDQDVRLQSVAALYSYNGTLAQVVFTDEVNYLTQSNSVTSGGVTPTSDGHLWNADPNSNAWTDLGEIQGADGEDGISITLDPATVIFEQDENDATKIIGVNQSPYFSATVRVWQGSTPLTGNFITGVTGTNCTANYLGNVITISAISTDSGGHFYTSGKVDVAISVNSAASTLTLNWAANLLGSWKASVVNDAYTSVSSKPIAIIDSNGNIVTSTFETVFSQTAQYIMLDVTGLAGKTGIDLTDGTIHLRGDNVIFSNSSGSVTGKVSIDSTTGTLHAIDGVFEGKVTAKNYLVEYADLITYCYDGDGMTSYFIPGDDDYLTMYNSYPSDPNRLSIDVSNTWYFMTKEKIIILPNYINMIGQRITIYNPTIGGTTGQRNTIIIAGSDSNGGDIIRGVGIETNTGTYEPVPLDSYTPVKQIEFCDGLVELQCVPSAVHGHPYEWCVVNIGTNVVKLRDSVLI